MIEEEITKVEVVEPKEMEDKANLTETKEDEKMVTSSERVNTG